MRRSICSVSSFQIICFFTLAFQFGLTVYGEEAKNNDAGLTKPEVPQLQRMQLAIELLGIKVNVAGIEDNKIYKVISGDIEGEIDATNPKPTLTSTALLWAKADGATADFDRMIVTMKKNQDPNQYEFLEGQGQKVWLEWSSEILNGGDDGVILYHRGSMWALCENIEFNFSFSQRRKIGPLPKDKKEEDAYRKKAVDTLPDAKKFAYEWRSKAEDALIINNCCKGDKSDSFWMWYYNFSRQVKDRRIEFEGACQQAATIGANLQVRRASMSAINNALLPSSKENTGVPISADMKAKMTARVAELADSITEQTKRMDELQKIASDAIGKLVHELKDKIPKYGKAHPILEESLKSFQDIYDQIPLDFALQEKNINSVMAAIELGKKLDYSPETRFIEAKMLFDSGRSVEGLFVLRAAVAKSGGDKKMRDELMKMECLFLENAIDKSQTAISQARGEMAKYLGETGFAKRLDDGTYDVRNTKGLTADDAWFIVSSGVTRSVSGIIGRADYEADAMDATISSMARAFNGLHVILRLRKLHHTFDEIATMSTETMMKILPIKDTHGDPFTPKRAILIATYVHEAMTLPDIKALMGNAPDKLKEALDKGYWDPNDVGNTWTEWWMDLSSPMNVFLLVSPFSIGSTGGRLAQVGRWTEAELATLEAAKAEGGIVLSGSDVLARMAGWKWAAESIKEGRLGNFLREGMEASMTYRTSGGVWWKRYLTVRNVVAGMIIQHTAIVETKKHFGVPAGLVVEALLMFSPDSEAFVSYLRLTPTESAAAMHRAALGLWSESKTLGKNLEDVDGLRKLYAKAFAAERKALAADEHAFLQKVFGVEWRKKVKAGKMITGDPETDAWLVAEHTAKNIEQNVTDGSEKALEKFEVDMKEKKEALESLARDAEQREKAIVESINKKPAVAAGAPGELAGEHFIMEDARGRLLLDVKKDSLYGRAEAALFAGEFETARDLFKQAHGLFAAAKMDREMVILLYKAGQAEQLAVLKAAGKLRPPRPAGIAPHSIAIEAAEIEAIKSAKWTKSKSQGAMGVMHEIEGQPYMVKQLAGSREEILEQAEAEVVHAAVARELGFDAPAVTVFKKDGQAYLASRRIEGADLGAEVPGVSNNELLAKIFAYRDDLSEHRMLAYILGDFDRHTGNYRLSADGKYLYAIDAGLADIRGRITKKKGFSPNDIDVVEGAFGRDSLLISRLGQILSKEKKIGRDLLAEMALTYKQGAADRIKAFLNNPERFNRVMGEAYKSMVPNISEQELSKLVEQAERIMKNRLDHLGPTMQYLRKRNLGSGDATPIRNWKWPLQNDSLEFRLQNLRFQICKLQSGVSIFCAA